MRVHQNVILETTDLTSSLTSEEFQLEHMYGYSIFIKWESASSQMETELTIEVSNDGVDWYEYYTLDLVGVSNKCIINVTDVFYKTARVKLNANVGSISPKLTIYRKGV